MITSSCPDRANGPIRVQPQRGVALKSILELAGWTLEDMQEVDPVNLLEVIARVLEATGDKLGIPAAEALAANLIVNTSQVTDIRGRDIKKDNKRVTTISLPSRDMRIAPKKLKTRTVKDVVCSF